MIRGDWILDRFGFIILPVILLVVSSAIFSVPLTNPFSIVFILLSFSFSVSLLKPELIDTLDDKLILGFAIIYYFGIPILTVGLLFAFLFGMTISQLEIWGLLYISILTMHSGLILGNDLRALLIHQVLWFNAKRGRIVITYEDVKKHDHALVFPRDVYSIEIPKKSIHLNLHALKYCTNLRRLMLQFTSPHKPKTIDITSLLFCDNLRISIRGDISDLHTIKADFYPPKKWCPIGFTNFYRHVSQEELHEKSIKGILSHPNRSKRFQKIQRGLSKYQKCKLKFWILDEIGLPDFSDLDLDIVSLLKTCKKKKSDTKTLKELLLESLEPKVKKHLEKEGTTHFIQTDVWKKSRYVVYIPKVVEIRERELHRIRLVESRGYVSIVPLWLTAYGFSILKAMGVASDEVDLNTFARISKTLKLATDIISTSEASERNSEIPDEKKEFILKYARFFIDSSIIEVHNS